MFHRWQSSLNMFPLGYHSGCPVFERARPEVNMAAGNDVLQWGIGICRRKVGISEVFFIPKMTGDKRNHRKATKMAVFSYIRNSISTYQYHTITQCLYFALVLATYSYIVHVSWARMPRLVRIFAPVRMYRNATSCVQSKVVWWYAMRSNAIPHCNGYWCWAM